MKKRDDQQAVKSAPVEMVVGYNIHTRAQGMKKNRTTSRNRYNSRATDVISYARSQKLIVLMLALLCVYIRTCYFIFFSFPRLNTSFAIFLFRLWIHHCRRFLPSISVVTSDRLWAVFSPSSISSRVYNHLVSGFILLVWVNPSHQVTVIEVSRWLWKVMDAAPHSTTRFSFNHFSFFSFLFTGWIFIIISKPQQHLSSSSSKDQEKKRK